MADKPATTGANRLSPDYKKATGKNRLAGKVYPKTFTEKAGGVAKELTKAIVEPVATMVARPVQLSAEVLFGVSDEKVNEFTKKHFGDWIAPTPQNMSDVKKDVGRGIQTAATAGFGGTLRGVWVGGKLVLPKAIPAIAKLTAEGASFGVGASLEQGNNLFSKETAKQAAIGAGVGLAAPIALKGVNRLLKGKGAQAIESVAKKEAVLPESVAEQAVTEPLALPPGQAAIELPEAGILESQAKLRAGQPEIPTTAPVSTVNEIRIPNPKKAIETDKVSKIISEDSDAVRRYAAQTNKTQVDAIASMDQKLVTDIAMGRVASPNQVPRNAYLSYLKNIADTMADKGDESLAIELSKSDVASLAGQELQASQIATRDSLTNVLRDVRLKMTERVPQSEKKTRALYNDIKKVLKDSGNTKPTRKMITDALTELKCK